MQPADSQVQGSTTPAGFGPACFGAAPTRRERRERALRRLEGLERHLMALHLLAEARVAHDVAEELRS